MNPIRVSLAAAAVLAMSVGSSCALASAAQATHPNHGHHYGQIAHPNHGHHYGQIAHPNHGHHSP